MSVGWPQTFALDLDQVRKALALYAGEPKASVRTVGARLGIGGPKVAGLNSWLKYLGLRDPRAHELTTLGKLLHISDPNLSDLGTLSVLHYVLCSNPDATIWYQTVNHFMLKQSAFTREELAQYFEIKGIGENSAKQLKSDLGLFLSTYTSGDRRALDALGFLRVKSHLIVVETISNLHPLVLGFALFHRLESGLRETTTSMVRLMREEGGPGTIFRLSEDDLRQKLHLLESKGFLSVVRVADIDGISYASGSSALSLLEDYYRMRNES
jgi:hypothetical protein